MNFSRFSAAFGHYSLSAAQKFAPDAPFSDNFRVFTRSGPKAAVRRARHGPSRDLNPKFGYQIVWGLPKSERYGKDQAKHAHGCGDMPDPSLEG